MQTQYKYLEDFINELRALGKFSFPFQALRDTFQLSDDTLWKALQRLKRREEIAMVRKEFYVIVPPEYRSKGMPPPSLYIADLMNFLARKYYVGLLNAAAFYGAAQQQSRGFSIITEGGSLRKVQNNKLTIHFYTKKDWFKEDIAQQKVDTGFINISSPELTALDIISYFDEVGGFNIVAVVLEKLANNIAINKIAGAARRYGQVTVVQRLGYLLQEVLQKEVLSDALFEYLQSVNHFPILLRPQKERPGSMVTGNRWKVIPNIEVEMDSGYSIL